MCGIVCYFADRPFKDNLINAVNKLSHRGPDHSEVKFFNNYRIGMGHSRLSIVDLSKGNQPISSEDDDIFVVVNGELYDYQSIKIALAKKGYKFKTNSDSEIIIPLYQEYGLDLFKYLRGEFVFVLYDLKKERVIVGRDNFGIKPLYYYYNHNTFFVASEIKSILQFNIEAKWNNDAVMFGDFFIPRQDYTYFKDIFPVKPGHYILYEKDKIQEKQYWDISYNIKVKEENLLISQFKSILIDAVKTRLHGDVPIACYVSGGIDSTSILSIIAKELNYKVTSFNICFDDSNYDESTLSKHVADFLGVEYVPVPVNSEKICDNFRSAIYHNEGLIYNNQTVAKYILSKAVNKAGFKVVLTGEGADEVLAGYPFFKEDIVRSNHNNTINAELDILRNSNKSIAHVFLTNEPVSPLLTEVENLIGYIPSMWRVGASYGNIFLKNIYTSSYRKMIENRNPYIELVKSLNYKKLKKFDNLNSSMYLWSKTNLPEVILSFLGDRMEMANSVEGRLPFLDCKVVEFCQSLPLKMKINGSTEKYILREALKSIIPTKIYSRQKFPFTAPPVVKNSTNNCKLESMMFDVLHSKSTKDLPFYDQTKILRYINDLRKHDRENIAKLDPIINRVVSASILSEEFKIT